MAVMPLRSINIEPYVAKILASSARWAMIQFAYSGIGDAIGYHSSGVRYSVDWAAFQVPEITGRSMGTRFVESVTGLLYAPYQPHILGGFWLYATIAFFGQILFYVAYRRAVGNRYLKAYAIFTFFTPTLLFWPSSIGKDALMLLFLGMAFYGAARLFERMSLRWLLVIGLGLWGATVIRSHVALLAAGAMRKPIRGVSVSIRRWVIIGVALIGALAVATLFAETFGLGDGGDGALSIDLTIEDLDPVVADIERRTGQGGSAVDSTAITALSDLPSALTRVLFAPYLWQAHNAQALFAALDGAVMAGVFAWALPAIVRAFGSYRRHPYVLMASIYMVGFIVAFSAILNLGIMTRQRAQVTAAFLTLCFGTRELIVERQARSGRLS